MLRRIVLHCIQVTRFGKNSYSNGVASEKIDESFDHPSYGVASVHITFLCPDHSVSFWETAPVLSWWSATRWSAMKATLRPPLRLVTGGKKCRRGEDETEKTPAELRTLFLDSARVEKHPGYVMGVS